MDCAEVNKAINPPIPCTQNEDIFVFKFKFLFNLNLKTYEHFILPIILIQRF